MGQNPVPLTPSAVKWSFFKDPKDWSIATGPMSDENSTTNWGGDSRGYVQSGQRLDVRGKPIGKRGASGGGFDQRKKNPEIWGSNGKTNLKMMFRFVNRVTTRLREIWSYDHMFHKIPWAGWDWLMWGIAQFQRLPLVEAKDDPVRSLRGEFLKLLSAFRVDIYLAELRRSGWHVRKLD